MLKLMNTVLLLMTLCGVLDLCYGDKLKCAFLIVNLNIQDNSKYVDLYSCQVTSLDNSNIIDGYIGVHKTNKNVSDVKGIWIHQTNTKLIPDDIGQLFNLIAFEISDSQLIEIRADNFLGMQELQVLSLRNNNLTSVSSNTFSFLPKLKYIVLDHNQLSEIPSGLFTNNLNLEEIHLYDNKIKFLGTGVFDNLFKVNYVDVGGNICVNEEYEGHTAIIQMKKEIKTNCKNPDDPHVIIINLKQTNKELIKDVEALKKEKDAIQFRNDQQKSELSALKLDLQHQVNYTKKINSEKKNLINELANRKPQDKIKLINEINILKKDLFEATKQQNITFDATEELIKKLTNCEANQRKSLEFNLTCDFKMINGVQYTCETRDLTIHQKEMELSEVVGTHLKSKSNEEVTELIIVKSSMFYWSKDIFIKFPALQILRIQNAQLNELKRGDFISASELRFLVVNGNNIKPLGDDVFHGTEHLTVINLNSNQIEEISAGTFRGLKQLKFLSLKDNLMTEIPFGSFKDIVMLEILILTGNKIKFLDGKMLEFNKRLMTLAVDQNELREVGEEILNHSVELLDVNLEGNYCIDERTAINDDDTDGRTMNDLIFVIRNCCKKPGEALNVYNCGQSGSED